MSIILLSEIEDVLIQVDGELDRINPHAFTHRVVRTDEKAWQVWGIPASPDPPRQASPEQRRLDRG